MKSLLVLCSLLVSTPAFAWEILATFDTVRGDVAYLVTEEPVKQDGAVVSFGRLYVEMNSELYRISSSSVQAIEGILCEPIKADFPYGYTTLETIKKGLMGLIAEKAVEITADGRIAAASDAEVVIYNSSCSKEMY